MSKKKKKGIMNYIFQFAGKYKSTYIKSVIERTDSMEPILAHVVPEFTANICAPIMIFIYILMIDWRMALLSLATLPIAGIAMIWMFKDSNVRFQKT